MTDDERLVVERLVQLMREHALAIADSAEGADDVLTAIPLVDRAAEELGVERPIVSVRVRDPAWLEGRRQIESFFIREVDRDNVVLYGEP